MFSEIEKKYVNSQDKYYNLDGTPCTKKQEIAWLDEAYEEKSTGKQQMLESQQDENSF